MTRAVLALALAMSIAIVGATGCSQGRGQRCQITADCSSGLTCNTSGVCVGGFVDAGPDAPADASADAGADAAVR